MRIFSKNKRLFLLATAVSCFAGCNSQWHRWPDDCANALQDCKCVCTDAWIDSCNVCENRGYEASCGCEASCGFEADGNDACKCLQDNQSLNKDLWLDEELADGKAAACKDGYRGPSFCAGLLAHVEPGPPPVTYQPPMPPKFFPVPVRPVFPVVQPPIPVVAAPSPTKTGFNPQLAVPGQN